jgi:regulatory protein
MATKRRETPALTESTLHERALGWLERFDGSVAQVRRVLVRAVERRHPEGDSLRPSALAAVESVLERLQKAGLVDDSRYALNVARGLQSRGKSQRRVQSLLSRRGVTRDAMGEALDVLKSETGDSGELGAARTFARKRRLGPFRPEEERAARRQRDLASLARAGFSLRVALQALELEGADVDEAVEHVASEE